MIKAISILLIGAMAVITTGCAGGKLAGATAQSAAAQRDYERLSGTWQLTSAVVNGKSVRPSVLRNTILITDHNTFRFPKASDVGTHPAGHFTVNPDTRPKQVDSIAEGGPNAGQLTRGIYEIIDATHKPPAGARPGARGRQSSSPLREAAGFFSTGRRSGPCRPINHSDTSRFMADIPCVVTKSEF